MAKIDYDNLTKQIVEYVGGVENIKTITHCVTRLRLYLNDRNKAEDEKIKKSTWSIRCGLWKSAVPDYSW